MWHGPASWCLPLCTLVWIFFVRVGTCELDISGSKVVEQLTNLAKFTDDPNPAVTRVLFKEQDMQARSYVKGLMREAGLTVREDTVGNIFGRWEGQKHEAVLTGSHCDAIPLAALTSFAHEQAANKAGYGGASHGDILKGALVQPQTYSHFVELHIEQGPLLEQEGLDIGIVTGIAAPAALTIEFTGAGGHAGALLMHFRNDAGLAAAEIALEVERSVLDANSEDAVGTTGIFEIKPGAINSVPREAKLGIDIRDISEERRDAVVQRVLKAAEEVAARRKVGVVSRIINQDPPATCSPEIAAATAKAAAALKLKTKHMVSRAYHDSLFMARIAPTSMIFIPCKDGISHRPDEFASAKHIEQGVHVLALTLAELSQGAWPNKQEL
ncbi:N-carbamyl-L-amino acid amidohydrolase [Dunaliella salina]|uniref:N-carbamyl-L-amino acid amidohydrolase n=1 Tax=Dunaliella salina TaxID=3046 RepID=A0ABQ7GQS4_DUNSA|nr:N-carbamyl-L-amino acid amidohydrolase [Dunaliella salina]|eukprot:KAF5836954.1 N-carbamyl-L-amino acid amidohydrolase [Dunaliella salina]